MGKNRKPKAGRDRRAEVIELAQMLIENNFGGDWGKAFDAYAAGGSMGRSDVEKFLRDAGVSGGVMLKLAIAAVVRELDMNRDGRIGRDEFEKSFKGKG